MSCALTEQNLDVMRKRIAIVLPHEEWAEFMATREALFFAQPELGEVRLHGIRIMEETK